MGTYVTSAQTRKALIMAAGELFAKKGIDAVSIRAIAKHADENCGSIHYHFKTKEGLLKAIMEFIIEMWNKSPLGQCWEKYEPKLDDPEYRAAFIRDFIAIHFERIYFSDTPAWCGRMFYMCMIHPDDTIRKYFEELGRSHRNLLLEAAKRLHPDFTEPQAFVWGHNLIGQITHYSMLAPMIQALGPRLSRVEFLAENKRQIIRRTLADLGLFEEMDK